MQSSNAAHTGTRTTFFSNLPFSGRRNQNNSSRSSARAHSNPEPTRGMRQELFGEQQPRTRLSLIDNVRQRFLSASVSNANDSGNGERDVARSASRNTSEGAGAPDQPLLGQDTFAAQRQGMSERLSRDSLRSMEDPVDSAYYLSKPNMEIVHFGPGKIAKGLFIPKVERASRERFEETGESIGVTAVFRTPTSAGFESLRAQQGLFSFQTVGGDQAAGDEAKLMASADSAISLPELGLSHQDSVRFTLDAATRRDLSARSATSIIGCIQNVTHQEDLVGLLKTFTDPRLKLVSASLTAAAYKPENRALLDADAQALKSLKGNVLDKKALADVKLKTTFGVMLLGLMQRYANSAQRGNAQPAVTLFSLENLKNNGDLLKGQLVNLAKQLDEAKCAPAGFLEALEAEVKSPNMMIDRIVPVPPDAVLCRTDSKIYDCRAGIVTEPFGRIVVEEDPENPDANLTILGDTIQLTQELDKHAGAKAGMLNAVHALSGAIWLETQSAAKTLPDFLQNSETRDFVKSMMTEIGTCLDPVDELDVNEYRDSILTRFQNTELTDEMNRLSSQLPRKVKQYIAPVIAKALSKGVATERLMDGLNVALKGALREDPSRRDELLNALSNNDPQLRSQLETKLARAERKLQAVGAQNVFKPIYTVGQSVSEIYEQQGLDLDAFEADATSLPIKLNSDTVVLFDNDGTLANSESIALKAAHGLVTDVLAKHEQENPLTVLEFAQRFAGKNFSIILSELNDELLDGKLTAEEIEQHSHEEDSRCEAALSGNVTATPHTLEALRWIPDGQKAVVTSASQNRCDASLETIGIKQQFSGQIYSAVDSLPEPRPKPDPAVYQHAMAKLGLGDGSQKTVVLEDSGSGVTSARRAGADYVIGFVGADNLTSLAEKDARAEKLRMAGATDIIDDMAMLPLVLEKRGLATYQPDAKVEV